MDRIDTTLLPDVAIEVCRHLEQAGGHGWLVGGCVRDLLYGIAPKDIDIEVYGLTQERVLQAVKALGRTIQVGKQFGVIKLQLPDGEIDIAVPRTETKTAAGHRGFAVTPDPALSPEKASLRRDFTINAMMFDPLTGSLQDFHAGRTDLAQGILRHVSPAFAEDPLRVLRGMQFAARFNLAMADETAALCHALLPEAASLPPSRIWNEWRKWSHAAHPGAGLTALRASGWLALYPELVALIDCPQEPRWHSEGDVWTHTVLVVEQAARVATERGFSLEERELLLLAALCHDLGKPATTRHLDGAIRSPEHCPAGVEPAMALLKRIHAPHRFAPLLAPLVREHLCHVSGDPSRRAVRRLAHRLEPASIVMWEALVEADACGRTPAPPSRPAANWLALAEAMQHEREKPAALLSGREAMALGAAPGPSLGRLLQEAYEAQLDGAFNDRETAIAWLRHHMEQSNK